MESKESVPNRTKRCLDLTCLVLSRPHLALSCLVSSCLVLSCRVLSCRVLSFLSCPACFLSHDSMVF
jgi:hypothetical protein